MVSHKRVWRKMGNRTHFYGESQEKLKDLSAGGWNILK